MSLWRCSRFKPQQNTIPLRTVSGSSPRGHNGLAFACCHIVSPFRGLTVFECLLLSLDLFRIFLTMHSARRKSLLLDSYENKVHLCSVLPNITCLFVNEMSEWGWLSLSLSPEPQEATFPLATALSR